jgi:hypothetical protein
VAGGIDWNTFSSGLQDGVPGLAPVASRMRQHGVVASPCIHGFAPGTCLICQTLEGPGASTTTKEAPPGPAALSVRRSAVDLPDTRRAGRDIATEGRSRQGRSHRPRLLGLAVLVVLALVGAWIVLHLVFAVLHILELVAVGLIAAYLGYLVGVFHGRRTARR